MEKKEKHRNGKVNNFISKHELDKSIEYGHYIIL